MTVLHSRVIQLEHTAGVSASTLEVASAPAPRPVEPPAPIQTPVPAPPPPAPAPAQRRAPARGPVWPAFPDVEELLGGRVLAWLGGIAVVLGIGFFLALAISRGWIGEGARTLMAAAGSMALLTVGIWLREQRGRNEAAMAAAAAGLAGLFLTIVVATHVYNLIPALAGIELALSVGAAASFLAIRWNAPVIGGIGTLGAVLSPAFAGAPQDATTMALLFVATAAGAAVLVYKRWDALGLALFAASVPQWVPWVIEHATTAQALIALVAFGLAGMTAAIGFELRSRSTELRHSAAFLFAANTILIGVAGWVSFTLAQEDTLAKAWIAGLAVAHVLVGGLVRGDRRVSDSLSVLSLGLGLVLADVAWGTIVTGPAVAVGWAVSAIGFALVAGQERLGHVERQAAILGLGGQIAIALIHVVASDAPVSMIAGVPTAGGLVAIASLAAACLLSARLAEEGHADARLVLDGLGLASVAYFTAVALDGPALVVAFAGEASALAAVARARDDRLAQAGSLGFVGLAVAHTLAIEAQPQAFLYGAPSIGAMAVASAAVAAAMARLGIAGGLEDPWPRALKAGACITALYAASVAIVSAYQPDAATTSSLLAIGVRQQGQMLVSAMWSLAGVGALVAGLTRGSRELRLAGLALLLAAIGKVFLFDLATLTSIYRVGSFIALGLVLLGGSYAWQRLQPAPLRDLREAS